MALAIEAYAQSGRILNLMKPKGLFTMLEPLKTQVAAIPNMIALPYQKTNNRLLVMTHFTPRQFKNELGHHPFGILQNDQGSRL